MDWTTNVFMVLIPIVGSGLVTWLINRRSNDAKTQLVDAQTWTERDKARAEMQRQIDSLFDDLTEARVRVRELEDAADVSRARIRQLEQNDAAREREMDGMRKRLSNLEDDARRMVLQLRGLNVTPDMPQYRIDELFKGTDG